MSRPVPTPKQPMTSAAMAPAARTPHQVNQTTAVEQSRAVAEVQAAVVIAQQRPRDVALALAAMREACGIPLLAERAFFRFARGGSTVSGESIHLARELARCWGNLDYGVKELARDDERGESEMLAFAWDLQGNTRSEMGFIVPHVRDTRDGRKVLSDVRDVYENNANQGARRVRECIFAVLPVWYRVEAADNCRRTIQQGGGKPLDQRRADCIERYAGQGITREQLERKIGRAAGQWLAEDIATLGVIYRSLEAGEIAREEEFPPEATAPTAEGGRLAQLEARLEAAAGASAQPASVQPAGAQSASTQTGNAPAASAPPTETKPAAAASGAPSAPSLPAPLAVPKDGKGCPVDPAGYAQLYKDLLESVPGLEGLDRFLAAEAPTVALLPAKMRTELTEAVKKRRRELDPGDLLNAG